MKDTNTPLKRILFGILILFISFPFIQTKLELIEVVPLKGAIEQTIMPSFSFPAWFEGNFQEASEKHLNDNFGCRNNFVRLNNQLLFTLFKKAKAKSVIVGKDDYLFETGYIDAFCGKDYAGEDHINDKIRKMIFLRDTFAKMNKTIIYVFSPSKARFYPEYIPDRYESVIDKTNYTEYVKKLRENKVDIIDINAYYKSIRDTSKFLLYPKLGIHWSLYGAALAQDSILHYIKKVRNVELPEMKWTIDGKWRAREADYDLAEGMNLMFRIRGPEMAYPKIYFDTINVKPFLSLLTISDSFYWFFVGYQIGEQFKEHHYWYYNNEVFPSLGANKPTYVKDLNLKAEIEKKDIFLIMSSEHAMSKYGFGFIDEAYDLYHR